jgi:aspartate-semialdehyde dehydrogenase
MDCDFVLSSLPSNVADKVEVDFAKAGFPVISNAGSHRMKADVPLLIRRSTRTISMLLQFKSTASAASGYIVTNPNCTSIGLVFPLAALHRKFGLEAVSVVTMQAISGCRLSGVASLDILDNVLPAIGAGDEDHKVETEPLKILGLWKNNAFADAPIRISAQTHRVECPRRPHRGCDSKAEPAGVARGGREPPFRDFRSPSTNSDCPARPRPAILVEKDNERPQPRADRDRGNGMAVVVGPVQPCAVLDYKFPALQPQHHSRSCGAAILNAELLYAKGIARDEVIAYRRCKKKDLMLRRSRSSSEGGSPQQPWTLTVTEIMANVRQRGDEALCDYSQRFDDYP